MEHYKIRLGEDNFRPKGSSRLQCLEHKALDETVSSEMKRVISSISAVSFMYTTLLFEIKNVIMHREIILLQLF